MAKDGPKGRKDKDHQEQVIKHESLATRMEELVKLHHASASAGEELNDAIKVAAEESGLLASVVRKFVTARAGEKYEEKKREVDQLSLCFDEIGEG